MPDARFSASVDLSLPHVTGLACTHPCLGHAKCKLTQQVYVNSRLVRALVSRHASPPSGYGSGSAGAHLAGDVPSVQRTLCHAGSVRLGSRQPSRSHAPAQHTLAHVHWAPTAQRTPAHVLSVQYTPNHTGHMLRAQHARRCPHQRPMPAVPYPAPHLTPLSQAQAVHTSYLLLIMTSGPLCPGKWGGPGGQAQHAPLLLRGLIPPPAWLGPLRPQHQAGGGGGRSGRAGGEPVGATTGQTEAGARGQGLRPGTPAPAGASQAWPVRWTGPQSRRQALPTLSAEVSRSWL